MIKKHLSIFLKNQKIPLDITDIDVLVKAKTVLEKTIANFPIEEIGTYQKTLRELIQEEESRRKSLLEKEAEPLIEEVFDLDIENIMKQKNHILHKTNEQAKQFLNHIAFKTDASHNLRIIANGKLLSESFPASVYQSVLEPHSYKDKTYWDIFKDSIINAVPYYNPYEGKTYFQSSDNHWYLNTYIKPSWKDLNLQPLSFEELNPILKTFLKHLFPHPDTRTHALKWCAHSLGSNLQTYLTLIGLPGIGKTIFASDFLAYYHGLENLHIVNKIEPLKQSKNINSTLFYFDELTMKTLSQYNVIKKLTNDLLGAEEYGKIVSTVKNYANVIWSCNTKDTMQALKSDDRRFKILPITDKPLNENVVVRDENAGDLAGFRFSIENIARFKNDPNLKNELVSHFLYILAKNEAIDDINSVQSNLARDEILLESRYPEFRQIFYTLLNVVDNYDEKLNRFLLVNEYSDEFIGIHGEPYDDFIPLGELKISSDTRYAYRIPWEVLRNVVDLKRKKHFYKLSHHIFKRECKALPPSQALIRYTTGRPEAQFDLEVVKDLPEKMRSRLQGPKKMFLEEKKPEFKSLMGSDLPTWREKKGIAVPQDDVWVVGGKKFWREV